MQIVAKRNSTAKYVWSEEVEVYRLRWESGTFPENVLIRILETPDPLSALDAWVEEGCTNPTWWRAQVYGWMDSMRARGFTEFTLERD